MGSYIVISRQQDPREQIEYYNNGSIKSIKHFNDNNELNDTPTEIAYTEYYETINGSGGGIKRQENFTNGLRKSSIERLRDGTISSRYQYTSDKTYMLYYYASGNIKRRLTITNKDNMELREDIEYYDIADKVKSIRRYKYINGLQVLHNTDRPSIIEYDIDGGVINMEFHHNGHRIIHLNDVSRRFDELNERIDLIFKHITAIHDKLNLLSCDESLRSTV